MSPFFNIFNLTLIRSKASPVPTEPKQGDAEPYYALFHWLATTFPVLYLPCRKHSDTLTTEVLDAQGYVICLHSWLSRFYNVPTPIVKLFEPERVKQKARIDAIIREAYGLRKKAVPEFRTADKLAFAGDRFIRWCIKIPQRIAGWPGKLLRR